MSRFGTYFARILNPIISIEHMPVRAMIGAGIGALGTTFTYRQHKGDDESDFIVAAIQNSTLLALCGAMFMPFCAVLGITSGLYYANAALNNGGLIK